MRGVGSAARCHDVSILTITSVGLGRCLGSQPGAKVSMDGTGCAAHDRLHGLPASNRHRARCTARSSASRDFVHCRFADAGRCCVWLPSRAAGIRKPSQRREWNRRAERVSSTPESCRSLLWCRGSAALAPLTAAVVEVNGEWLRIVECGNARKNATYLLPFGRRAKR
jgi:hypothetical protein